MDDDLIERLAARPAESDSAMKRLQGPDRASMSPEDALAAMMVIAEAASMMKTSRNVACNWTTRTPSARHCSLLCDLPAQRTATPNPPSLWLQYHVIEAAYGTLEQSPDPSDRAIRQSQHVRPCHLSWQGKIKRQLRRSHHESIIRVVAAKAIGAAQVTPKPALPVLGQALRTFAIDFDKSHTWNDWSELNAVEGVNWKWPIYAAMNEHAIEGVIPKASHKLGNVGPISLNIRGVRTIMMNLSMSHQSEGSLEVSGLGAVSFDEVRSTCTDDSVSNTLTTYRLKFAEKRPVYLNYSRSAGTAGSSEELVVFQSQKVALSALGENCVVQ